MLPVSIYIAFTKKKNVYIATLLFNLFNLTVYLAKADKLAVITYTIICVRSFVYLFKDKINSKFTPLVFIGLHILLGLYTLEVPIQVLAIIAPCLTCVYMWISKNEQHLRFGCVITNGVWFVYNILCGLYGLALTRIIIMIVNGFSFIRTKWLKKKQEENKNV